MVNYKEILGCFPNRISSEIERIFEKEQDNIINYLEEIRLRTNKPILLKVGQTEIILEHIVTSEDILETLQHICENSIYSYQSQICNRIYNN